MKGKFIKYFLGIKLQLYHNVVYVFYIIIFMQLFNAAFFMRKSSGKITFKNIQQTSTKSNSQNCAKKNIKNLKSD